jgi:UDPglucose--hexose-1-phosphate uridylyltransferase
MAALEAELRSAREWAAANDGGGIWCEIIRAERKHGERLVEIRNTFIALCPWVSRLPFETWILPLEHESHFGLVTGSWIGEFAKLLLDVLRGVESCLASPPYNSPITSRVCPTSANSNRSATSTSSS